MRRDYAHVTDARAAIDAALHAGGAPCLTCSFQTEGIVVLHMLRDACPDIPVLFLDTVHHFAETYAYRDKLARRWRLRLVNLRAAEPSPGLWKTSTQACCAKHKVEPLFAALEAYDVWFTGMRREQSPSRASLEEEADFTLPTGKVVRKISPLARWSAADVQAYVRTHDIPLLPLYAQGYMSIGCEPCTSVPPDPLNPRSGRWQGEKLECGIHLQPR
jgi:phosphoadenosine phosphosulfate reductase